MITTAAYCLVILIQPLVHAIAILGVGIYISNLSSLCKEVLCVPAIGFFLRQSGSLSFFKTIPNRMQCACSAYYFIILDLLTQQYIQTWCMTSRFRFYKPILCAVRQKTNANITQDKMGISGGPNGWTWSSHASGAYLVKHGVLS